MTNVLGEASNLRRTIVYIDGFNLYFGIKSSGLQKFLWLNVQQLAQQLIKAEQKLMQTKYFTSRISGANTGDYSQRAKDLNAKRKRQSDYLEALMTAQGVTSYFGKYQHQKQQCAACKRSWDSPEEKMTDVNIATELLSDAFLSEFDFAIVVSADSDLVPPIKKIRVLFPEKRVIAAFPPGRSSAELGKVAHGVFNISESMLRNSQFPDRVRKSDGYEIARPIKWS